MLNLSLPSTASLQAEVATAALSQAVSQDGRSGGTPLERTGDPNFGIALSALLEPQKSAGSEVLTNSAVAQSGPAAVAAPLPHADAFLSLSFGPVASDQAPGTSQQAAGSEPATGNPAIIPGKSLPPPAAQPAVLSTLPGATVNRSPSAVTAQEAGGARQVTEAHRLPAPRSRMASAPARALPARTSDTARAASDEPVGDSPGRAFMAPETPAFLAYPASARAEMPTPAGILPALLPGADQAAPAPSAAADDAPSAWRMQPPFSLARPADQAPARAAPIAIGASSPSSRQGPAEPAAVVPPPGAVEAVPALEITARSQPRYSAAALASVALRHEEPPSPIANAPQENGVAAQALRRGEAATAARNMVAPALVIASAPDAAPLAMSPVPPAPPAAPATPSTALAAPFPDLASVVEAIDRARAEARPDAVAITVRHADFGQVALRFEQHDGDLTVAMSSADPGFAAAVSAATTDPSSGRSLLGGEGARQDARNDNRSEPRADSARADHAPRQSTGDGSGHSRSAPDRREEPAWRLRNRAPADEGPDGGHATDSSIFA